MKTSFTKALTLWVLSPLLLSIATMQATPTPTPTPRPKVATISTTQSSSVKTNKKPVANQALYRLNRTTVEAKPSPTPTPARSTTIKTVPINTRLNATAPSSRVLQTPISGSKNSGGVVAAPTAAPPHFGALPDLICAKIGSHDTDFGKVVRYRISNIGNATAPGFYAEFRIYATATGVDGVLAKAEIFPLSPLDGVNGNNFAEIDCVIPKQYVNKNAYCLVVDTGGTVKESKEWNNSSIIEMGNGSFPESGN